MVSVRCDPIHHGLPLAFLSSRQAKKEISTWTKPIDSSGCRLLFFDVPVTGNDPGAGGAVKQGADERDSLGHPDILVETARFPSMPDLQISDREGGGQHTK